MNKFPILKIILSLIIIAFSDGFSFANINFKVAIIQDTVIAVSDSISQQISEHPEPSITQPIDSWDTPWQLSKLMMSQYFQEDPGDIIQYIPGIYLKDLGSSGQELFCGFRGANDRQTAIFFDGHPIYDPIKGGIDLNFIPVGFVKEISIGQGVGSYFARTNEELILLKSDIADESIPFSQVSYHKAPFGYSDVDVIFGRQLSKKLKLLLGGFIKSFNGKSNDQIFEQQNFRGKVNYLLTPWWHFQYSWISNKINRHVLSPKIPALAYTPLKVTEKLTRSDHTLNIYGRTFKSSIQNFSANLFYSRDETKWQDKSFDIRFNNTGNYTGFNFQNFNLLFGQKIMVGGDLIHEWIKADSIGVHRQTFGAIFLQDDFNWKNKLDLRILTRYQWHSVYGSNLTGGIGFSFQIGDRMKFMTLISQAIRYPTFFEQYARDFYRGTTDLKAESHQKLSTGLELKLKTNFLLKADFYVRTSRDVIDYELIDSLQTTFINRSNTLSCYGFDVQINFNLSSKILMVTELSMIDATDLINYPKFRSTSYIQYSDTLFQKDLVPTLRLEGKYIGNRKSIVFHPYYYVPHYEPLKSVVMLNAHAILDFGNLKVYLMMENLLNQQYQILYGYPMKERTLHYGLRWEFWN